MPTRSSPPARQILDTLYPQIERVLRRVCEERYDAAVTLEQVEESPVGGQKTSARIKCPSVPEVVVHFAIESLGRGVYELSLDIDDGPSRQFIYCPPNGSGSVCGRVQLERKVVSFILDEMDRQTDGEPESSDGKE